MNTTQSLAQRAFPWTAALAGVTHDVPFSFIYGGQPSREFLKDWKREHHTRTLDAQRIEHTLRYRDPQTGLEARAVIVWYADTQAVDWTLYFTNTENRDTPIIEHVNALDVEVAAGSAPVLHRLQGSTCARNDWQPFDEALPPGARVEFATRDGKSSLGACPFFNLEWDDGGVVTAIGWSGQWGAALEHLTDGRVCLQAGMQHLHLSLHPGETIRSPRILQLYWTDTGDPHDRPYHACNLFRQHLLRHVVPKVNGKTVSPPIVHLSTSFYELNDSTEANVLSHLDSIKGLGFEFFWLDAYWTRDGFPNGMGHYGFPFQRAEPPDRFPRGLKPIGEAAHNAGMGFVVWFEPERVASKTHIANEHPDWVIAPDPDSSGLLNLGLPEAREYMTKYLIEVIKEYRIDCLRIDYNISPLRFWQFLNEQDPERVGMAEIRYVEGLYRMWDEILSTYPHLFIDNCASGGMRIDLETCARSIPLWRTDATIDPLIKHDFNQAALQNQVMTAGLSRYVPFHTSGMMGATPYWFRSGFNAGISFCEDCRPADYPAYLLRQAIAEGKRLRKYYCGNFYPLSDVTTSPHDWSVLQYHRSDEHDGMVVAFRRHRSPYASFVCALHEINPTASYEVTLAYTYEPRQSVLMTGVELQQVKIEIEECPGSLVLEYKIDRRTA